MCNMWGWLRFNRGEWNEQLFPYRFYCEWVKVQVDLFNTMWGIVIIDIPHVMEPSFPIDEDWQVVFYKWWLNPQFWSTQSRWRTRCRGWTLSMGWWSWCPVAHAAKWSQIFTKTSAIINIGLGSRLKLSVGACVHARTHSACKRARNLWPIISLCYDIRSLWKFVELSIRYQRCTKKTWAPYVPIHACDAHKCARNLWPIISPLNQVGSLVQLLVGNQRCSKKNLSNLRACTPPQCV